MDEEKAESTAKEKEVKQETVWQLEATADFNWSLFGFLRRFGAHALTGLTGILVGAGLSWGYDLWTTSPEESLAEANRELYFYEAVTRLAGMAEQSDRHMRMLEKSGVAGITDVLSEIDEGTIYYKYGVGASPFAGTEHMKAYPDDELSRQYTAFGGESKVSNSMYRAFATDESPRSLMIRFYTAYADPNVGTLRGDSVKDVAGAIDQLERIHAAATEHLDIVVDSHKDIDDGRAQESGINNSQQQ